jgi:hypothetical protein
MVGDRVRLRSTQHEGRVVEIDGWRVRFLYAREIYMPRPGVPPTITPAPEWVDVNEIETVLTE